MRESLRLDWILFILVLLPLAPLPAQEHLRPGETVGELFDGDRTAERRDDARSSLLEVVLTLGAAVAGLAAAGWGLVVLSRKFGVRGGLGGERLIKVVARTGLAPRQAVYLLSVADHKWVLVGVSGDGMRPLLVLDGEEAQGIRDVLQRNEGFVANHRGSFATQETLASAADAVG